jgi:2-(1,2-epoxy-1,2-dihydrophenyl)acetyl-CoA isomerase|tara:strand:+ start:18511 stop:19284 length:774 start_codon:yes stop_codon:yes gene_type:complete
MNFKTITLKKVNRIGVITLNRPKVLNAFNEQLIWDLQEATNNLREDDDIRVVVITGAGKGFTAGADLTQSESTWTSIKDSLNRGFLPIFKNIMEMPKPVIGSINGPAAGIGAAIAMACDLRIMSENAYILSVFSNIAIVPDGGLSWLLTRYMGYTKAFEYAIEAKKITADECINFGIANKKVLLEDLESETMAWAERLAKRAPQSLSNTKKIMRNALEKTYLETYAEEAEIQNKIFGNDQNKEAIKAFFEKREPNFD